ncbi:hypothetical protein FQN60_013493, partial [Etheostoma spectabile]
MQPQLLHSALAKNLSPPPLTRPSLPEQNPSRVFNGRGLGVRACTVSGANQPSRAVSFLTVKKKSLSAVGVPPQMNWWCSETGGVTWICSQFKTHRLPLLSADWIPGEGPSNCSIPESGSSKQAPAEMRRAELWQAGRLLLSVRQRTIMTDEAKEGSKPGTSLTAPSILHLSVS